MQYLDLVVEAILAVIGVNTWTNKKLKKSRKILITVILAIVLIVYTTIMFYFTRT